jgi:hypothetical protein
MGEARRAREKKKCWQGLGSSLRKLSSRQRAGVVVVHPFMEDARYMRLLLDSVVLDRLPCSC